MAAAGVQAGAAPRPGRSTKGGHIPPAGNPPLGGRLSYCIVGGARSSTARDVCLGRKAVISWGSCASWGCVQAAKPNRTRAPRCTRSSRQADHQRCPGCPPIAEVMTGIGAYITSRSTASPTSIAGAAEMFYSQRIHDKCYRRPHFDAGQFVEQWDDEARAKASRLYKMGCRGPTYNACSRSAGTTACLRSSRTKAASCSEDGFWDNGLVLRRLSRASTRSSDRKTRR